MILATNISIFGFEPFPQEASEYSNSRLEDNTYDSNLLMKFYQTQISSKTLHRCPFKTTCSKYLYLSVKKQGFLLGTISFVDRFFYRENINSYHHYEKIETNKGVIKLNDDFFLK